MQLSYKIPLTCAILAGGKSLRMKSHKCLISINDVKIIDLLILNLKELFEETFIVTNFPELYFYTGIPLLGDLYSFRGPMGGIHVALKNSKYDVFAFACDMPFIKKEIVYTLAERHISEKSNATVASLQDKIYPLPGIYSKKLVTELENLLLEGKLSMKKMLDDVIAQVIDVANLDKEGLSFININTEEDLKILKKRR